MHISSLSSPYGIGTMGRSAREFVDFLVEAGQKYWQILPLNPTDQYGSPYAGVSAFAWNTSLIDTGKKTLAQLFKIYKVRISCKC